MEVVNGRWNEGERPGGVRIAPAPITEVLWSTGPAVRSPAASGPNGGHQDARAESAGIAGLLGLAAATVRRVLVRYGVNRPSAMGRARARAALRPVSRSCGHQEAGRHPRRRPGTRTRGRAAAARDGARSTTDGGGAKHGSTGAAYPGPHLGALRRRLPLARSALLGARRGGDVQLADGVVGRGHVNVRRSGLRQRGSTASPRPGGGACPGPRAPRSRPAALADLPVRRPATSSGYGALRARRTNATTGHHVRYMNDMPDIVTSIADSVKGWPRVCSGPISSDGTAESS